MILLVIFGLLVAAVLGGCFYIVTAASQRAREIQAHLTKQAAAERRKNLEAWHRYWHEGCYTGNCKHEDELDAKVRLRVEITCTWLSSDEIAVHYGPECRAPDRRTRDNRFPYLAEWLSAVDRMLEAGDDLLGRERQ